jgi:hypothetical protein
LAPKDAANIRPHPIAAPINMICVNGIETSPTRSKNAGPRERFPPQFPFAFSDAEADRPKFQTFGCDRAV